MKAEWQRVPCLVCGSSRSERLHSGSLNPDKVNDLRPYVSSARQSAGYGPVVRCQDCRFVYANPQPTPDALQRTYEGLQGEGYAAEETARRRTARRRLRAVERHCSQKGRLLDVGCSAGLFVDAARQGGWQASGLEPSAKAVHEACSQGLDVRQGVLEHADLPDAAYDVITLWDVLEHLTDPATALDAVRQALRPDGLLVIDVPNINSWCARLLGRLWPLFLVEHLWYFSRGTLKRFLAARGFRLIALQPHTVTFSLGFIGVRLAQQGLLPAALTEWLSKGLLSRIAITFAMGEMTAVAVPMTAPAGSAHQPITR